MLPPPPSQVLGSIQHSVRSDNMPSFRGLPLRDPNHIRAGWPDRFAPAASGYGAYVVVFKGLLGTGAYRGHACTGGRGTRVREDRYLLRRPRHAEVGCQGLWQHPAYRVAVPCFPTPVGEASPGSRPSHITRGSRCRFRRDNGQAWYGIATGNDARLVHFSTVTSAGPPAGAEVPGPASFRSTGMTLAGLRAHIPSASNRRSSPPACNLTE